MTTCEQQRAAALRDLDEAVKLVEGIAGLQDSESAYGALDEWIAVRERLAWLFGVDELSQCPESGAFRDFIKSVDMYIIDVDQGADKANRSADESMRYRHDLESPSEPGEFDYSVFAESLEDLLETLQGGYQVFGGRQSVAPPQHIRHLGRVYRRVR